MPLWSCPSCRKVATGRLPTWRQPRRCRHCGVLVWPDALYSYERDTPLRADLGSRRYPQAVSHLSAEIRESGDLVLEGQDLGPLVDSVWGDSDYEYWVTVPAPHLNDLVRRLIKELNAQSIPLSSGEPAALASDLTQREVNRLALILLRKAFAENVFTSDTEFSDWLKRKRIPSHFFSY